MARPKLGDGKTQRFHMAITADEIKAIDDYRYKCRIPTRSEAVRHLVKTALVWNEHNEKRRERWLRNGQKATRKVRLSGEDRQFLALLNEQTGPDGEIYGHRD